jgi:hypothetical protein
MSIRCYALDVKPVFLPVPGDLFNGIRKNARQ